MLFQGDGDIFISPYLYKDFRARERPKIVDTTAEATSRVQAAVFYALRDLQPGHVIELVTAE